MSDKENMYFFIPFGFVTNTIEESLEGLKNAIEFNAKDEGYRFCLTLKGTDKMIGGIGYTTATETPVGKIADPMGWFIMPEYQNKGYITEAAKRLLEYAFLQDNCIRVVTACFKENIATQKVMAKLCFRKEAEKLNAMWHDGKMRDRLEFAINKNEFMRHDMFELKSSKVKLEVFIPKSHFSALRDALCSAQAGVIGNYENVLSYSTVQGNWRPLPGANPYDGDVGVLCEGEEYKVEVCCQVEKLTQTIFAIKAIHPYEEPVINIIPLLSE